jgi:hypothetical protein
LLAVLLRGILLLLLVPHLWWLLLLLLLFAGADGSCNVCHPQRCCYLLQ